jgi:hypothetical protein
MIRDEVGCLRLTFHLCPCCAMMRRADDASGLYVGAPHELAKSCKGFGIKRGQWKRIRHFGQTPAGN